jgi:hypothetical protein
MSIQLSEGLYNAIYKALTTDTQMLALLGLSTTSTYNQLAEKVIKSANLSRQIKKDILPTIHYYTPKGMVDPMNDRVFASLVLFEVYVGEGSINKAHQIADRIFKLLVDYEIQSEWMNSFKVMFAGMGEINAGVSDVYCYGIELIISFELPY